MTGSALSISITVAVSAILGLSAPGAFAAPPVGNASALDAQSSLESLQQLYDQSCGVRAYGAFDDVCDELTRQLRQAANQAERDRRKGASRTAISSPGATALPSPAAAAAGPTAGLQPPGAAASGGPATAPGTAAAGAPSRPPGSP